MIVKLIIFQFLMFYLNYLSKGDDADDLRIVSKNTSVSRVRGSNSEIGEFSYSVIFYEIQTYLVRFDQHRAPICSGNVLSTRWVLITATPLGYYSLDKVVMFAGTMEERTKSINTEAQYRIDKIIIHPQWHENLYDNLGLARTEKGITFGIGLGTTRIPFNFKFANQGKPTLCKMVLWAAHRKDHLMGRFQSISVRKQSIHFNVYRESELCSNFIPKKTLCLLQFNDSRIDVCSVNIGSTITCGFGIVGIFTGGKNYVGCVDEPPLSYSAINLHGYVNWIKAIVNQPILIKNVSFLEISCSDLVSFNFSLLSLGQLFLYFNALNV